MDVKRDGIFKEMEGILASPQNHLLEKAVKAGRIPIGYTCSFVPEALLMADALVPVRVRAPGTAGTEIADNYLSNFICSYTRSLLESVVADRYDLIRGWVFVPSCAHMQRLIDNVHYLKKLEFSHVLDVPHKSTAMHVEWLTEEYAVLADKLSSHFGVDLSDEALAKAVGGWNEFVEVMKSIGELRKRPESPITGTEFHLLLMAAQVSPKDMILPYLLEAKEKLEERGGSGRKVRARLMLIGGELDDPEYIRVIESQNAVVVADRTCTGSIPGLTPIELNGGPLIKTLAEHSFKKTLCPRMMEDFDRRLQIILDTVREYRVDGVVIEVIKFCDLWGVDMVPMVKAIRSEGIPVLKLEREYRLSGEGQMRTRVQAFIESMGK
jgi:benzoyl-CoA reductase/2-hydroxyglutaryl-CoA dehydratase subunit BcrC/BadD/HgdB